MEWNLGELLPQTQGSLRKILGNHQSDTICNEDLWWQTNQQLVEKELKKKRWLWISHTLKKLASPDRSANGTNRAKRKKVSPGVPERNQRNRRHLKKMMGCNWEYLERKALIKMLGKAVLETR